MTACGVPTAYLIPTRIGRYEIVGLLAVGGMAEVFLGRIDGPNGFQRPIVVKRMLPHLARRKHCVEMFVDEARILARLHHPNIIDVFEHGCDGELFLAMEYVDGESVSVILRRAALRGVRIPYAVAARIIAEACAGLHSAHELTDEDGRPLDIVHRDVSPQNLMVSYDGHVKILDFGIAKVRDRTAQTETGQIKGKVSYMAPEQVVGGSLDRRTDVFSAGVVLYELTTGRRLFPRDSPLATMWAARTRPILPPSRFDRAYPPALEAVCLRALSRDPDTRYASASSMRKDLHAAIREMNSEDDPDATARLMASLFEDRIARKSQTLSAIRAGSAVTRVETGETDEAVELPVAPVDPQAPTIMEYSQQSLGRRSSTGRAVAAAFLCLSAVGSWGLWAKRGAVVNPATTQSPPATGESVDARPASPPPALAESSPAPSTVAPTLSTTDGRNSRAPAARSEVARSQARFANARTSPAAPAAPSASTNKFWKF
jgi:serine/threonine-protein kinase